jgi:hypothetical protein
VQTGPGCVRDAAQTNATDSLSILLGPNRNQGSSTSTVPRKRSRPGRTMARRSLCSHVQAVE